MLDSVVKVGKKYYPQVFLEECKYIKRKNKMFNYINDDLEIISSDEFIVNLIVNLLVILIVILIIKDFY